MTTQQFISKIKVEGFVPRGNEAKAIMWQKPTELDGLPEAWFIREDEMKAVHYGPVPSGAIAGDYDKVEYLTNN